MHARWSEVLVHWCSVLLGINSLISTNGIWMELPIMMQKLPEGWALGSYMTVIIQLANIAPIIYSLLIYLLPGRFTEKPWIYGMLVDGFIAAILMGLFWDQTITMNGTEHSIPLFILTFFLAIVDALSSLVCLPFMAVLMPIYLNSYMIGEGLSGFLPSIAALIQGTDESSECQNTTVDGNTTAIQHPTEDLRFTVSSFFYFLAGMIAFSLFGFFLLCHTELAKLQYAIEEDKKDSDTLEKKCDVLPLQDLPTMSPLGESYVTSSAPLPMDGSGADEVTQAASKVELITYDKPTDKTYYVFLGIQTWVSCLTLGTMPSIQSYSCAPYGQIPLHLAIVLPSLANPVTSFVAIWLPLKSISKIVFLTCFGTALAVYLMVLAVMSPTPPLVDTTLGSIIMVAGWIIFAATFGYVKVAIACRLRDVGHNALFWFGVMTQIGATVGAIVMFVFVNVLEYFEEEDQC